MKPHDRDDESTLLLGPGHGSETMDRMRERLRTRKMTKVLTALATIATMLCLVVLVVLIVKREW